jgi:hypothetical protein
MDPLLKKRLEALASKRGLEEKIQNLRVLEKLLK